MSRMFCVAALALLGACGGPETTLLEVANTDEWDQVPTDEVDILFVVDDSASMHHEQQRVANGFAAFISEIEATGTDWHIGVTTTSVDYADPFRGKLRGEPAFLSRETPDYETLFRERVSVGVQGASREKGLESAEITLSPALVAGANAGFVRPEAFLLMIFVSDEEDCSDHGAIPGDDASRCYAVPQKLVPVEAFAHTFTELKGDRSMLQIGAIVGVPRERAACREAVEGQRYAQLAHAFGGKRSDICEADYAGVMYDLGLVASGLLSSFRLSDPAQPETIRVWVDETEIFEDRVNGWTYDETNLYLTFNGDSVPGRGAHIVAEYEIGARE